MNLTKFHILNQMTTLSVDISQVFHFHSHLTFHWRSLSQIHSLHQVTLPVDIPQVFQKPPHLTSHWRSLSRIYHVNQVTIPVDTPQYFHLHSHMTFHWRNISHIHHLQQVTIPVDIPQFFLSQTQPQCYRNPSKSIKWPFPSFLTAFLMHFEPYPSNWIHRS